MELLDCALCAILVYECDYGYFPIFVTKVEFI